MGQQYRKREGGERLRSWWWLDATAAEARGWALSGRIGSDLDYKRGGRRDIRVCTTKPIPVKQNATKNFKLTGGSSKIKE